MLGPLLFVYKGFLLFFFVLPKICHYIREKKIQKSLFKKKLSTEHKFEKCCEAKKMHKGHISGPLKQF